MLGPRGFQKLPVELSGVRAAEMPLTLPAQTSESAGFACNVLARSCRESGAVEQLSKTTLKT